ncbi:sulfotransferase family 2 domain-containing protein [Nodosilinea sp. AN01ver1]|uniref:sulfotransferase family 2 domain-containing protein n=1 Tax=Nodosilinea sp. AN01ver1 TaxID=3423362 RepID=UPI003D312FB2
MNQTIILFTHIPKTGGTSIKKSLIVSQDIERYRFTGFASIFLKDIGNISFLEGHYPYGVHHFLRNSNRKYYFVILREPLDRAVSYYYFVRQCDTLHYRHPNLEDVKRYSIGEFYKHEKYKNIQTKFIAGFPCNKISKILPRKIAAGTILKHAKKNLEFHYNFFGFLENIDFCQEILSKDLNLSNFKVKDLSKVTQNRPKLDDLDQKSRDVILEANLLDLELYNHAKKVFRKRYKSGLFLSLEKT